MTVSISVHVCRDDLLAHDCANLVDQEVKRTFCRLAHKSIPNLARLLIYALKLTQRSLRTFSARSITVLLAPESRCNGL